MTTSELRCHSVGVFCRQLLTAALVLVPSQAAIAGHVFYAGTHDHSTMGVATGAQPVSTYFDVPASIEMGAGRLAVAANGIPSPPVAITVN
jgi:hypothetical protein